MLSEGRVGIDHIYSLAEGILRLEVDKATFERMGLEGKPISSEGRKHVKARFGMMYAILFKC
jgi:ribonuclease P/MRP protein subunit RPP40